jgi:hypothetical protein
MHGETEPVEAIAQAIHERWRELQRDAGNATPPTWAEIDESRRNSSRSHARDIAAKLDLIGYTIAPLHDIAATQFTFPEDVVELLGAREHDRWMQERIADGWTSGPKDADKKTTPYLVPFAELPPEIAEYDRVLVREIPSLLAAVGLQVVRVDHSS